MNIHEYQGAEIFKRAGLPVPLGKVVSTAEEAVSAAQAIGYPCVLKSQVLVGGRGKAGGIKVVKSEEELKDKIKDLFNLTIKGYPVEKVYIVRALDIRKEFYLSVAIDGGQNDVVLIASAEGGVEIEETAKTNPDAIKKFYLHRQKEIDKSRWGSFISSVFNDESIQKEATEIFQKLVNVFFEKDCSLVEINPLVIDGDNKVWAADAKVNLDDNAAFRQDFESLRDMRYEDPDELEAKEAGLSFVKLDGTVGCVVNGAGLAMGTLDVVSLCGGSPANFLDVGGSSNPQKVLTALKIILRNPNVKAILINIFGGITRCDDIASGILQARSEIDLPVPLVVRLTGTNEKEAKEMLAKAGVTTFSSMRKAVEEVVKLAK